MAKNKKDKKLYMCYSLNLRDFLSSKGLRYELAALNVKNSNLFWVYMMSDELSKYLTEWTERK